MKTQKKVHVSNVFTSIYCAICSNLHGQYLNLRELPTCALSSAKLLPRTGCINRRTEHRSHFSIDKARLMILCTTLSREVCSSKMSCTSSSKAWKKIKKWNAALAGVIIAMHWSNLGKHHTLVYVPTCHALDVIFISAGQNWSHANSWLYRPICHV